MVLGGICFTFYMPREAERQKIEENALNPSLNKMNSQHNLLANEYYKNITESMLEHNDSNPISFLSSFFESNHIEYSIQNFKQNTENGIESRQNIVGIYRAQRSNNYECNLIAFDINPLQSKVSIPFALSFIKYYDNPKINYISRDVIFLGYDSRGKNYGYSVEQFLKEYQSASSKIPRCGVIRQALNIDLEANFNLLYLKALGFDGKVPDRDYFIGFNTLFNDALTEKGYRYTEVSSKVPVQFGAFLEAKLHEVGQLIKKVFPMNYFNNFKHFFHILIAGIYGEKHDAHSQMLVHGIQAVTIKGKFNQKIKSNQVSDHALLSNLFNIVDGAQRANFGLDEQLHAGSTLYYPVTKTTQVTIQKLPITLILIALPLAIQFLSTFFRRQSANERNNPKVYSRFAQTIFHSFIMLGLPSVAEILYPTVFPSQGNPLFTQSYSSLNNPQLINLFKILVGLIVISRLLMKIVVEFIIIKGVLKLSLKENQLDGEFAGSLNSIVFGGGAVVYLFVNTSICYFMLIILGPFFYLLRPIIPRSGRDIIKIGGMLASLYLAYFVIIQFELNYVEEIIDTVITYKCVPSHTLWFALSLLFNLAWSSIEIFLI